MKRWWWGLLVIAVGLGLWRLRFDADVLDLLPPDEPTVQGLKLYQSHFANARELILTLRAPNAEVAEHLAGDLAARLRQHTNLVAGVSWQPPWMEDPSQMGELIACMWLNQPPEAFDDLTNRLAPGHLKSVLDETKETLATSMSPMDVARGAFDPYGLLEMPGLSSLSSLAGGQGQQMFASAGGNFRVLFVQSAVDLGGYRSCENWLSSIRAVVERGEGREPGVVIRYTGRPVFVVEIARSMRRDMSGSVAGTSLIIALLFWLTHRRWLPMFWLLALLGVILVATLGLGSLVLGAISVISMGFAAVLLGLAVDYAVVHYQEALAHPTLTVPEIRRAIAPSILWAAITTMSAFLVLNLGGLPGLGQLGTLVAIGVGLAALVMVMIYLPPLFPARRKAPPHLPPMNWWSFFVPPKGTGMTPPGGRGALGVRPSPSAAISENRLTSAGAEAAPGETPEISRSKWPAAPGDAPSRSYGVASGRTPSAAAGPAQGSATVLFGLVASGLVLIAAGGVLSFRRPGLDASGEVLRPQHSEAEAALDEMKSEMGLPPDPLWLIVRGRDEAQVYQRLAGAEGLLSGAASQHLIGGFLVPTALWPRPERQAANRQAAAILGRQGPLLREAALSEGFNSNAVDLTEQVVRTWARAGASTNVVWPTNQASQWLLKRFVAREPGDLLVMGLVYPVTNKVDVALEDLSSRLARGDAYLSGWGLLGSATLKRVRSRLWQVVTPMALLVLASLGSAFRRPTEILLGLAVLGLSGLCVLATMAAAGWSWNLLNLMALPLMLGTGVDYSIFMQLALRRHGGDLAAVRRSIGRALLLCGGTAVAGFGSLAWSSNPGMASLGKVCAVGIGANMLFSVFLLPAWWTAAKGHSDNRGPKEKPGSSPDRSPDVSRFTFHVSRPAFRPFGLYRAGLWRLGLALVRVAPARLTEGVGVLLAEVYCLAQRSRRDIVLNNLLPVLGGDHAAARKATRRLHRNFALKLADLWRMESGAPMRSWTADPGDLGILRKARAGGRGLLFITLHLGSWEHGGLMTASLGMQLTILTQAEPDNGLTDLRVAMRRRLGVETLIIGQDSFAFVEAIKRLQAGAALAIALDRPPARNPVRIEWFGQPFEAPVAAAELARASGCALVGVTIVRRASGYAVKVLPEFVYDRQALGSRDARRDLTQQILRAFEPEIRNDIEQWYQFVPIWPASGRQSVRASERRSVGA
jgi:predicted RND superfamily exporter protein/lauroyl/myristoyl acyltransferase